MTINIINQSNLFDPNRLYNLMDMVFEGVNESLDMLSINTSSFKNLETLSSIKLDIKFDHSLPKLPKINKTLYIVLEDYFKNKNNKIFNKEVKDIYKSLKENDIDKAEKIYGIIENEFKDVSKIKPSLRRVIIILKKMFLKRKSDNIFGYYKCFNRKDKNLIVIYDERIKTCSDFLHIFMSTLAHEFFHFFHFLKYVDNIKNTDLYLGTGNKTYDYLCCVVKETCATLFEFIFADNMHFKNYSKNRIRDIDIYIMYMIIHILVLQK